MGTGKKFMSLSSLRSSKNKFWEVKLLTLFFPMFPFDLPENIRKPLVFWSFQGDQKGKVGRKRLTCKMNILILNPYRYYNTKEIWHESKREGMVSNLLSASTISRQWKLSNHFQYKNYVYINLALIGNFVIWQKEYDLDDWQVQRVIERK